MVDWNQINFQNFQAALWHLEQQWPKKLARLLKTGKLESYLTETVQQAAKARAQMRQENPDTPNEVIREIIHSQIIAPENPKYPDYDLDDLRLSPQTEELLAKFRKEVIDSE